MGDRGSGTRRIIQRIDVTFLMKGVYRVYTYETRQPPVKLGEHFVKTPTEKECDTGQAWPLESYYEWSRKEHE